MARYSPYLLLKYHCNLNVEVYKYYFKYLYNDAARGPPRPGRCRWLFVNLGDL